MSKDILSLPFSAVRGMDLAKKALMCMAADDTIKGVLIKGPPGTAKSVLVRSFFSLTSKKKLINIPPNVSDDQLFGGLDFETAIKDGVTTASGGLLSRADGNVVYVDNVNLMEGKVLDSLLESIETGDVIIEREGVSSKYKVDTSIVVTMDPSERELPDSVSDRFDMCVTILPEKDAEVRIDIIMSDLEHRKDPEGLRQRYSKEDAEIIESVERARTLIPSIKLSEDDIMTIVTICKDLNVRGYRGDISTAKTARALAALDGRKKVTDDDIADALVLCLTHRREQNYAEDSDEEIVDIVFKSEEKDDQDKSDRAEKIASEKKEKSPEDDEEVVISAEDESKKKKTPEGALRYNYIYEKTKDALNEIDEINMVRLHEIAGIKHKRAPISRRKTGRYRGFRIPKGKTSDPAFDATIRAAAPYQRTRESSGLSIKIEKQDIREKVRTRRNSSSFIFAVDISGSLVTSGMMPVVQNAIRAMLMEGYVKRDRAALITFRERDAEVTVPFTRSVELISDTLEKAPAGGSTPLAKAVLLARDYATNYLRKHPGEKCYVIFITDGFATMPAFPCADAMVELERICATVKDPNIEWTVIDSSEIKLGERMDYAVKFAGFLGARYIDIFELDKY